MSIVSASTGAVTDIITKIEDILEAIGFNLEDLSSIDQNNWTQDPLAQLLLHGETFLDTVNERPATAELSFLVKIGFRNDDPSDSRTKQYFWAHECRDNIITTNINDTDKLVRWVSHDGYTVDYDGTYSIVDYSIVVGYRNESAEC